MTFLRTRAARGGRATGKRDTQPVMDHIAFLKSKGVGYRRIAELTGLSTRVIQRVGQQKFVQAETARRILSLRPEPFGGARISTTGSIRRLQALVRIGYTQRDLAGEIGITENSLYTLMDGRQNGVTAAVAEKIDEVFRRLQMTRGGSVRARVRAERRGWPPPFAWDLDAIDDPDAEPDLGAAPSFLEQVEDFRSLNRTDAQIAAFFGVSTQSVRDRILRHEAKGAG